MSDNIVSFKPIEGGKGKPAPDPDAITPEEWETLTEDQKSVLGTLASIGTFLLENKMKIDHLVAIAAVNAEDNEGGVNYFVLNTPISNANFALCLKMLDNAFTNNINLGRY